MVVEPDMCSHFYIESVYSSQNLKSPTQKAKIWFNNPVSRRFWKYSFLTYDLQILISFFVYLLMEVSSVPNRRVGWNNPVGGIFYGKFINV